METTWPKGPIYWIEGGKGYVSVPFTWNLPGVLKRLEWESLLGSMKWYAGGPAVDLMPLYLKDVAECFGRIKGVLQRINPMATRSTIGCPNNCGFCAVPKTEGVFGELKDWPDLPIYIDNNLLAASRKHFDKVIDRCKRHKEVDFNQGLDARLLTKHHAERLRECNALIRLAWDDVNEERCMFRAFNLLREAGIPRRNVRFYVLLGYKDTPEDALYRLRTIRYSFGTHPNPMRYAPLDSLERNVCTEGAMSRRWTDDELRRYMRYWSNSKIWKVPFEDFSNQHKRGAKPSDD